MAKVSVVMPAYNVEPFLERAVGSVLHTSYPDLEIVIIEDGSTDETLEVAQAIQIKNPDHIKLLRHNKGQNRGAGASRNLGMRKSSGEIIAFLDADDLYLRNRFENCIKQIVDKKYDVVFEKSIVIYQRGEDSEKLVGQKYKYLSGCEGDDIPVSMLYDMPQTGAVTFRRSVLNRTGGFNERLSIGQDREFFIRLSIVGKVKNVTDQAPVSMYVRHGANRWVPKEHDTVYVSVIGSALRWMKEARLRPDLCAVYRDRLYSWTFERSDKCIANGQFVISCRYLLALGWHYPASWFNKTYVGNCVKLFRAWIGSVHT